jgi:MinD superfamily P-loop ATPase
MHEILIISGKGGTGKTSITAAFAHSSQSAVICDLDVDAPDLHLVLRPDPSDSVPFVASFEPVIDASLCTRCGVCQEMCRFHAIHDLPDGVAVNPLRCEGCGVCMVFCPEKAIAFTPKQCGEWRISNTRFGPLVHAQLYPGEENSGKLVTRLRKEAKALAQSRNAETVISDGPPGIGCPVISSMSGQDLAVVVTEPTPSGLHDMRRIIELCGHFRLPTAVIINKCNLHRQMAAEIHAFCEELALPVISELPYDTRFVEAMVKGLALTELAESKTTRALKEAWENIVRMARKVKKEKAMNLIPEMNH